MNRIGLSIGLLFSLAFVIYVPDWFYSEPDLSQSDKEEAWRPNYQAINMTGLLYNGKGELSHEVHAQSMQHYRLLGFTSFEQPEYKIYVEQQAHPWRVSAQEGTLYQDNRILLETNVEIMSTNHQGFVQKISTQFMEIHLNDKKMLSDQRVEIEGAGFTIVSQRFKADLTNLRYELTNDITSIYAPN